MSASHAELGRLIPHPLLPEPEALTVHAVGPNENEAQPVSS